MNNSIPYKQRILDFLDMVGAEGVDNAKIPKETGIPSHQQVYLLTQELTMRREITARREGRKWVFYPLDAPSPGEFHGHWWVVSSPDFDPEFLEMETTPFVSVEGDEFAFEGTFHIGLIQGEFDGRLDGKVQHRPFSTTALSISGVSPGRPFLSRVGVMRYDLKCRVTPR